MDAADLGRYFADVTERRRIHVAAAAERIARAKADEAIVVAEIEQQADEAISAAADSAGDRAAEERSHHGWPTEEQEPAEGFPVDILGSGTDSGETERR